MFSPAMKLSLWTNIYLNINLQPMITSNNQTTDYTQEKVTENGELFDLRYPNTNEE